MLSVLFPVPNTAHPQGVPARHRDDVRVHVPHGAGHSAGARVPQLAPLRQDHTLHLQHLVAPLRHRRADPHDQLQVQK